MVCKVCVEGAMKGPKTKKKLAMDKERWREGGEVYSSAQVGARGRIFPLKELEDNLDWRTDDLI